MNVGRLSIIVGSVCLVAGISVSAVTPENPYGKIVARNLFGLKDPPPPPDPESNKPPPPGIYLQGLTTILGRNQVLFKVSMPARPPQPAGDVSKMLAEGEREDEITVLEINMAERTVKFDNHGTVETKNMKDHAAKPGGGSAVVAGGVPQPGLVPQPVLGGGMSATPLPGATPAATPNLVGLSGGSGTSARASNLQSIPTRQSRTASTSGVAAQSTPPPHGVNWPPEQPLTPEQQEAIIAVQQELHANDPNFPPVPGSYVPDSKRTPPAPITKPQ